MSDINSVERVHALLSPCNVAIVGASDRPGNWSSKVLQTLKRCGFDGAIYPVNPRNATVWNGAMCYPNLSALPETPDHVAILVPGVAAIDAIREAGRAGARSATIFSSGFGEGDDAAGRALGISLKQAVRESGLAVSGPNCIGNLSAPFNLCTMADDRLVDLKRGPIGLFGQSGGIVMAIYRALRGRGIDASYAISSGNEVGLTTADYIRFMVADPDIKVICCFIESIRNAENVLEACCAARSAGKPIIAIKIGGSEASRSAALAHTGALAGSLASFDAVTRPLGVLRVDTIDEMVECAEYFSHAETPQGVRVGAVSFSGGLKGLLLEAAERNGVSFPALSEATLSRLKEHLSVGTSMGNPIDAGFAALSSPETYLKCIDIVLDDPSIDVLLLNEELPPREGQNAKVGNLRTIDAMIHEGRRKPIVVVSFASYMYSDYTRLLRKETPHLAIMHDVDNALRAVARAGEYGLLQKHPPPPPAQPQPLSERVARLIEQAVPASGGYCVLGEVQSKELLAIYGIEAPQEVLATDAAGAVEAAKQIGFPVVLKLVSDDVQHKSDIGGVVLNIGTENSVRRSFKEIRDRLNQMKPYAHFGGVLVAQQITGGQELVLGVHRDPEVGLVSMFGTGGVLLELKKDVRFGPVPLNAGQAAAMIDATMAGRLLKGFRGTPARDAEAVNSALVGLARLAADLGDKLDSIDVNPLVALAAGKGVLALDALVVLRNSPEQSVLSTPAHKSG